MKRSLLVAAVVSVALFSPSQASARGVPPPTTNIWGTTTCGGATLLSCVGFDLTRDVTNRYFFSVTYLSSLASDPGVVTSVSLYDLTGAPDFDFTSVILESSPTGNPWTAHDGEPCDTNGDGVGSQLFEACADADAPAPYNGLTVGETVVFSFLSNYEITTAHLTATGGLSARAHIQSFGAANCSLKFDSRSGVVGAPTGGVDGCNQSVVPEPATLLLLASGMVGVVGAGWRRKRREGIQTIG